MGFELKMTITQRLEEVREQAARLATRRDTGGVVPPEMVAPDYDGHCISNLPGTILELFGAPAGRHLPAGSWSGMKPRRVVLIVLDALGLDPFLRAVPEVPALAELVERGSVTALTSVFPSTTNVALTSLYTGLTPAEHGIVGLNLYLRQLGITANLLFFRQTGERGVETLRARGVEPRSFFLMTTLFEQLATAGVRSASMTLSGIPGSSLGEIHHAGAEVSSHIGAPDLCVTLGRLLAEEDGPRFICAYWDMIDRLSHRYGPGSEEVRAEVAGFFTSLQREVLERLTPAARRDMLLLITADHGQLPISGTGGVRLDQHPEIVDCLLRPPTGGTRCPYVHILPGRMEILRDCFHRLEERFTLVETGRALAGGLFGPGEPHPEVPFRVGEAVALSHGSACLWRTEGEGRETRGIHGGLSREEMLVPLLAVGER